MNPNWAMWPESRRVEAIRLWNEGKSAGEIAAVCGGLTRNAVIGVIHRARARGEITRIDVKKQQPSGRLVTPKAKRGEHQRVTAALVAASGYSPVPVPPTPERAIPYDASFARPWVERRLGQCAYPVSGDGADTLSCCAPTKGKPYCSHHCGVMYAPRKATENRDIERLARLAR